MILIKAIRRVLDEHPDVKAIYHEYIRYVLPKKISFDELTQEQVLLMINHINKLLQGLSFMAPHP